jgi:tripartite-type tricarboxylate transporter receptor subunit TctC
VPFAQQDRPVRFILPNAVGSGVDAITRAAQPALANALGAPIVVENQTGAGGVIGLQALARSAPDGNTLSVVSNNVVIFPSVLKSLPFDMPGDFTPIAKVGSTPMVLVVNPAKVAATSHKELAALLKAKPDAFNYASSGSGTILHLAVELYLDAAGLKVKHIPYKGVGPMVTDLLGGQVDFAAAALPSVQGHIASGKLRPIGLVPRAAHACRAEHPTFAEQGLANFEVEAWFAVIGPKGMSAATVKKVYDAARRGVQRRRGQGSHGEAGKHDQHQHYRAGAGRVPYRDGEVRRASEESRPRAAIIFFALVRWLEI